MSAERFRSIFILAGVFSLSACDQPRNPDDQFEQLCRATARVVVHDPVRWREYVKLAVDNSPRLDHKPTIIQINDFTVLHGKMRDKLAPSFPVGLHDDETAILYAGKEIALLLFKVRVTKTIDSASSSSCIARYGLEPFIKNEDA